MSLFNKERKIATELIRKASEITEWFKKKGFRSFLKSDQSPVTIADYASQIYILSKLQKLFPDDEIIAEEENVSHINKNEEGLINQCFNDLNLEKLEDIKQLITYRGCSSNRQWTVDPIDGTMGYKKSLVYAIGIGLMINSIPKIGAIAIPNYINNSLAVFSAEENQGSQVSFRNENFKNVSVSQINALKEVHLCHSLHYDEPWVLKFAKEVGIKNYTQIDSMAKFCMVAEGSADLYIKPLEQEHSFSWDFLPGDLIVREAGGEVTDLNGEILKYNDEKCLWTAPAIIASNGHIQSKILDLYKRVI
jgi:3'-phosphoadenosine 5'-phosphosulfate (PAPS) 3'-phosphatase